VHARSFCDSMSFRLVRIAAANVIAAILPVVLALIFQKYSVRGITEGTQVASGDKLSMTSRERVLSALEHERPDRVPIDLGGSICTSINVMAYQKLKGYLDFKDPRSRVSNILLFVPEVEEEMRQKLHIDVVALDRLEASPGVMRTEVWKELSLPNGEPAFFPDGFEPVVRDDGTWELYHEGVQKGMLSPLSGSFVPTYFPLKGAGLEYLEEYDLSPLDKGELELLGRKARDLYERTTYAIFGWLGGSVFEATHYLLGFDEAMLRFVDDRTFMARLFERLTEQAVRNVELYLDAVGPYIQVIGFYDDFGIQTGPMISPSLFRELVKPQLKKIFGRVHELSEARVFLHSCGSVYEFIEDFIEVGVDILNPVQTSAFNMAPDLLKEEFGDRIVFWGGGCDVQRVLPLGTPGEVRADVRKRVEVLGRGGGFVFAPIHNILADVPPENVLAMYDEALQT
jgi:uroporphyrinogen decarboxylase